MPCPFDTVRTSRSACNLNTVLRMRIIVIRSVEALEAKDDYQRAVMEPTQMHDSKWICEARLKFGMARLVLSCKDVRVVPVQDPIV